MINYCIIGKNWGKKIFLILKNKKKNVYLFNSKYKYSSKKYFIELKNFLKKSNINFVWIATPPLYRKQLIANCINFNQNIILEKPILFSKSDFKYINEKLIKKKKFLFVHFEYIFLKKFQILKNKKILKLKLHFHHKKYNEHQISPYLNNGTHLVSIKKRFFKRCKNISLNVSEGKKNLRLIELHTPRKVYKIDFTKNKEPIIQRFIYYIEHIYRKKKYNYLNLKFGYDCTNFMKKYLKNIKKI